VPGAAAPTAAPGHFQIFDSLITLNQASSPSRRWSSAGFSLFTELPALLEYQQPQRLH
jgi:hypothetical protein